MPMDHFSLPAFRGRAKIRQSSPLQSALLYLSALFLFVSVVCPLFILFGKAFASQDGAFVGLANFRAYFSSLNLTASLLHSFHVSSIAAVAAVTLAFLYAYALGRTNVPFRNFFRFSAMLPLFAPTMMLGIGLIYLIGNKGLVTMAGLKLPLYGPLGIIVSEIVFVFPQAFLILLVSLSYADNRLYEASRAMGAGALRTFTSVTLPGVRFGLASALFVSFTLAFTDFGAPKVVGGNYNVLATDIYKQVVGQQNFNMGAVVGILLMIPAVLSFAASRLTQRAGEGTIDSKSIPYRITPNRTRDTLFTLFCVAVNVFLFAIIGAVVLASLVKAWPYNLGLTLTHFKVDSPATGGIGSFGNSVLTSAVTALLGTAFVFLNAWLIEKTRGNALLRQTDHLLSLIPLALPGLAIGIAFIFFFNAPGNPLRVLYGTMWILVLANVVHFYSVPFVTATSALKKLDREIEAVSESMAVSPFVTFCRVTLPMCLPAILEIAIYFFVNAMVTVSAVVFLYPADFKLASVAIVNMEDAGDIAPAAALSVLVIATNVIVRIVYELVKKITSPPAPLPKR